jgi:succinate dehydrogenase / fumarate reductase membrane anchor subunit
MNLRSPLSQARGLGSAKEGVNHWWLQRLTALALIPLSLWFVASIARYHMASYELAVLWIRSPFVAIALVIWLLAMFYHAALGMQVIIEDYVGNEGAKLTFIVLTKFGLFILAAASLFAVLKIAFGAA